MPIQLVEAPLDIVTDYKLGVPTHMNTPVLHGHLVALGFNGPDTLPQLRVDRYVKRLIEQNVPDTIKRLETDLLIARKLLEEMLGPNFAKYDPHAFQRFQLVGTCDDLKVVGLGLGSEGAVDEEVGNCVTVDMKESKSNPGYIVVNHRIRAESVLANCNLALKRLNEMEAAHRAMNMLVERGGVN